MSRSAEPFVPYPSLSMSDLQQSHVFRHRHERKESGRNRCALLRSPMRLRVDWKPNGIAGQKTLGGGMALISASQGRIPTFLIVSRLHWPVGVPRFILSRRLLAEIARGESGNVAKASTGDPKECQGQRRQNPSLRIII